MKRLLTPLVLCLALLTPDPALEPSGVRIGVAIAAPAPDEADQAPLLVQAHQAFIRVNGPTATGSTTWTVAVVDPARAEGSAAPAELEGASARGAEIRDGQLRLPAGITPGTVLTFQAPLEVPRSPFRASGVFRTAPGLPTARAELVVRSTNGPLSVWTDSAAQPTWKADGAPEARIVWRDVGADEVAEAVWSASPGWTDASAALDRAVKPLLTDKVGRVLGQNLDQITPTRAAERVFQHVKLVEGPDVGWIGRPSRYVIEGGSGTRAERGAVLISVLRAAGYDARPALYRPSTLTGHVPTSLAAPSMLRRPVVAVLRGDGVVWIDPGGDALPPDLPAELTGAMAWMSGDLPRLLDAGGGAEGTVPMSGEIRLDRDGGESFTLNLTATGTADAWLRERLRDLDDVARAELFRPLVAQGRPELDRLSVSVSGLGEDSEGLRVTLRGHAAGRMERVSAGIVKDTVPPVVAPALAAWLPPRIAVHEELGITPPPGLRLFTSVDTRPPTHPGAVVATTLRREADRIAIVTEVERPTRHLAPTAARQADQTLRDASAAGPELLYIGNPTARTARAAGSANLDTAERTALQAMVWWRVARYGKARKQLAKVVEPVGLGALDAALVRYGAPYELRRSLADLPTSDADKLASIPILIEQDRRKEAWIRASEVAASRRPELRVAARLHLLDLQPAEPPDPAEDADGAARYVPPDTLLEEADEAARRVGSGEPDPRVLARRAERALAAERADEAVALLETATGLSDDPGLAVALARASAAAGAPLDDVHDQLQQAVARAPSSPELLADVSDAYAAAGQRTPALAHALAAARLDQREQTHWARVVDRALEGGQLTTALFAARKASDLSLANKEAASRLTRVATLAGDEDLATLGWNRGGTPLDVSWPAELTTLIGLVEAPHLLALLRHHDAAVVRDPGLLSLRAELELEQGDRDRAVRDGALLAKRHGMARGEVVAFGASLGRAWSSNDERLLNRLATQDVAAKGMRIELKALYGATGNDQRILARDLASTRDDPRSKLWLELQKAPDALAARDPDWQAGRPPRGSAPRGFSPNPTLSSVNGVTAWSSPASRQALLRHGGSQPLPPPLTVLYTVQSPPLRSLPGEGRVFLLKDGAFPVYAAARQEGTEWVVGLGTSAEDAARALEAAPPL